MSTKKQSEKGKILSGSKKIKKIPRENKSKKKSPEKQKYNTYDDETKEKVIQDLIREIRDHLHLLTIPSPEEFTQVLKKISLKEYNKMLEKILLKNIEKYEEKMKLVNWRKKVKGWVLNNEKPETRGGLVVPAHFTAVFDTRVEKLIDQIEVRIFADLRKHLFRILKDLDPQTKIKEASFSKHWWHNYRQRHPDIKKKWSEKPLKRTVDKGPAATEKWRKNKNSQLFEQKKRDMTSSVKKKPEEDVIIENEILETNYQSSMSSQEDEEGNSGNIEEELNDSNQYGSGSGERSPGQFEDSEETLESGEFSEEMGIFCEEPRDFIPPENFLNFGRVDEFGCRRHFEDY